MRNQHWRWWAGLTTLLALFQIGSLLHWFSLSGSVRAATSLIAALEVGAALIWALLFGGVTVTLVRQRQGAVRWSVGLVAGFVTYSMARLLFFSQADYDRNRLSLMIVITTLFVVLLAVYAAKQTE